MLKRLTKEQKFSLGLSVVLHLAILIAILVQVNFSKTIKPAQTSAVQPIKAIVIDQATLQKEHEKIARKKQAQQEVLAAQQQRIQEEKRLAEIKKQQIIEQQKQEAQKIAEQKIAEQKIAEQKTREQEKARVAALEKEKKRLEQEKQKEEQRLAEVKRQRTLEEEKRKAEQAKLAEAAKLKKEQEAKEQAQREKALKEKALAEQKRKHEQQLTAQKSRQFDDELSRYAALVKEKVQRNFHAQGSYDEVTLTILHVRIAPGGDVMNVNVATSSGIPAFDRSAVAAVYRASPLPVPDSPEVFNKFRNLELEMSALELMPG